MKRFHLTLFVLLMYCLAFAQTSTTDKGSLKQTVYIDFGKNNEVDGKITTGPDRNGHYWNNAIEPDYGKTLLLINAANGETGFVMEITKKFSANGIKNGGLLECDKALLGDFAVNTATQDYFYIEGNGGNGSFRIKNLNKNRAYKFYVFGSRKQTGKEERVGYLSFTGSTGSHGTHRMTGTGIGANGESQNNKDIYVSDPVFPDHKGEINFQMIIKSGGFAHINIMKIEEYADVAPLYVKQDFYIDFGRSNTADGHHTTSPDANNHYWNNAFGQDAFAVAKEQTLKLINSANTQTGIEMVNISNFRSNGIQNGGLTQPDSKLLDDLAIASATEDYFFIESGTDATPGCIDFKNMDPEKGYRFHVFGSRDDTADRIGLFTFTGQNVSTGSYKMGGTNAGGAGINKTNDHVYVSDVIHPDANGKIRWDIALYASNFSHINAMKIEECTQDAIVKATSISLSGNDITESGQTSQIIAAVLPENATYPAIQWEVDNTSIARIDNKGVVYPKTNGTVTVAASIVYDDITLSDKIEIHISGQLGSTYFTGSALEEGDAIEMHMLTDLQGTVTNHFEAYTSLKGTGQFSFYRDLGNGAKVAYGAGKTEGTLAENGTPIETTVEGPVRIRIDLTKKTYTILPITSLTIVGTSTPTGTDVTKGMPLNYQGKGVWAARLFLNSGDPRFNFILNKNAQECLKRVTGTNKVIMQSHGTQYSVPMEDIRTNMNGGEYYISIDLKNYTYAVSCGETDEYKISYMGSSVANGSGALNNLGYAYMYTNLLKQRHKEGIGLNWTTSNVSIGGNTTANLLNRWERDLLSNCSRYVIYGLSLGNEGIHEKGESAYISYRDGMLKAIKQAEDAGIVPVMANNYTRADFNATDYNYVKRLNLAIHEWDLPSINTLGAIDDGAGHWANGYQNDNAHPNTAGHEEFCYAIVPSLFDALEAGKPLPVRVQGTSYDLGRTSTSGQIAFIPENVVHPFTLSVDIKTTGVGTVAWFENESANGFIKIDKEGRLVYESPRKGTIRSAASVNKGNWQRITLTHYHAWGITLLYVNDEKVGELFEKLAPKRFVLGSSKAPDEIQYRELFFWRAGMNADEIAYVNQGKMMKSSLEIYAPLGGSEPLANLAQSTNLLKLVNANFALDQKIYIDFGKDNEVDGNITTPATDPTNNWNNAVKTAAGTEYELINAYNRPTDYKMVLTTNFLSNGIKNGGLQTPNPELLGDFAIPTATQDYFFIEENNGAAKGGIDFKNLNPGKAYKFYAFGSRSDKNERTGLLTFTGTNSFQGTHRMGGSGIAVGDMTGDAKNQNNSTVFVSEAIYPDANGTIHFELARHIGKFAHINAMKIEEYSVAYAEGTSPLISNTPTDGSGVRIARIHSASGGFTNEGAENVLLDKSVPANKNKKWCYNSKDNWVIVELSDFYDVDKFTIEDCRTRESEPNFPEYYIYVSTTGTATADWKEVVHETNQTNVMYKTAEINPTKARYIKLVPKGIDVVRIYAFRIYGRKSFDSVHDRELISVGKPVIGQQDSPNVQCAAVALFDANVNAANSKWTTSKGDKQVVVDLEDTYTISQFKLYDAKSVNTTEQNINGYKVSVSSDLSVWDLVVDATEEGEENVKTHVLSPAQTARYVKLEIPEERMSSSKTLNLYEFSIFRKLNVTSDNADLHTLQVSGSRLTPAFTPERTTYSMEVAKEVELITILAEAKNENSVLSGDLGEKKLKLGENSFFITVTSADGTGTKTYTIQVNRAEKSSIAGLESLSIENLNLIPAFSPSTHLYRTEVKATSATVLAKATGAYATITGVGQHTLSDGANQLTVKVTSEDETNTESYTIIVYNTENLISVASPDGKGKRITNIDAYSGMTHVGENPFRMLRGWKENLSGDNTMKWCDTSKQPWVIFSLSEIYTINHIEFRDCKMVESGWANVPQYSVYVSTTDTLDGSWTEIVNEQGVSAVNEKIKSFDPVDARFVKFIPSKGDNAIRIYGFDIYGKFKETVERDGVISVGKTIVRSSTCTNDMVTPSNVLDGRSGTAWEFTRGTAFVEIDLEETTQIGKCVLVDSPSWINGYKVSVSNTGNGADWKQVAAATFEEKTMERKAITLDKPETARYVRLDIPQTNQYGTNHIKEFEIYQYVATGIKDTKSSSPEQELLMYPNPVSKGMNVQLNKNGIVKIYSLKGTLLHQQNLVEGASVSTSGLIPGSYVIQVTNENEMKQGKLIVNN